MDSSANRQSPNARHFNCGQRSRCRVTAILFVTLMVADPLAQRADLKGAEPPAAGPPGANWCTLGPYVEFTGARTAVVRWETKEPSSSIVEWGKTQELGRRVEDATLERMHEVTIDRLKWKAKHYFR
ncbi:MAG: hypothetical protein ACR2NU_16980, partial [Aeoliella sp.]